jgi:hypothetical protein
MKLVFNRDKQFDDSQLYYQWLHARSALPLKSTRPFVILLWILAFIFFVTIDSYRYSFNIFLLVVVPLALFGIPVIFTLLEFLYFLPRAIVDDTSTELMGFIFSSPVSTGDIVSGLRKFYIRINLLKFAPPIAAGILVFLKTPPTSFELNDIIEPGMSILCSIAIWWFLVESGIFTAALPKTISVTGAIVLIWVVPILVGVFWGGYKIASIGWDYFLGDVYVDPGFYGSGNFNEWQRTYNLRFFWYSIHYIVLLLIPTLYLFFNSRRHMELRRRGRWI